MEQITTNPPHETDQLDLKAPISRECMASPEEIEPGARIEATRRPACFSFRLVAVRPMSAGSERHSAGSGSFTAFPESAHGGNGRSRNPHD
jgi:hypothetical protein